MRAMIAANDDRPSFAPHVSYDGGQQQAHYEGAAEVHQPHALVQVDRYKHCVERQKNDLDYQQHRLQSRFPSAIQPVRLSRGEVARIPELMRILDRRTAKK